MSIRLSINHHEIWKMGLIQLLSFKGVLNFCVFFLTLVLILIGYNDIHTEWYYKFLNIVNEHMHIWTWLPFFQKSYDYQICKDKCGFAVALLMYVFILVYCIKHFRVSFHGRKKLQIIYNIWRLNPRICKRIFHIPSSFPWVCCIKICNWQTFY